MAELAERVRHDLERREVDRPVDLVPRDEPLALAGDRVAGGCLLPTAAASNCEASVGFVGVRGDADVGVGGRRVLEPGEVVAEQRLAEPVVVEPRQPLRLREEVVDPAVGFDRDRLVVVRALEPDAGELVLVVVPFVLVVLLRGTCGR